MTTSSIKLFGELHRFFVACKLFILIIISQLLECYCDDKLDMKTYTR